MSNQLFYQDDNMLSDSVYYVKKENGILHIHYSSVMTLSLAETYYKEQIRYLQQKAMPQLMDCRKLKKIDKKARAFLTQHDYLENITAIAILIESSTQELLGNFFIYHYKLKIPAQIFTEEKEALGWLENFKV